MSKESIKAMTECAKVVANAISSLIIMLTQKGYYDDVRKQGEAVKAACARMEEMVDKKVEWYYATHNKPI